MLEWYEIGDINYPKKVYDAPEYVELYNVTLKHTEHDFSVGIFIPVSWIDEPETVELDTTTQNV